MQGPETSTNRMIKNNEFDLKNPCIEDGQKSILRSVNKNKWSQHYISMNFWFTPWADFQLDHDL